MRNQRTRGVKKIESTELIGINHFLFMFSVNLVKIFSNFDYRSIFNFLEFDSVENRPTNQFSLNIFITPYSKGPIGPKQPDLMGWPDPPAFRAVLGWAKLHIVGGS